MRNLPVAKNEDNMLPFLFLASKDDELFHSLLFGRRKEPEEGKSYLIKEKKPDGAMTRFIDLAEKGHAGLVITRQHPNHIMRKYNLNDVRVIWLSTTLGKDYVDPHNLNSLTGMANIFLQENNHSAILLDGLEYLMVHNDFDRVLKFIEYLNELVMQRQAVLLISVDDRAFESRELALLERNATVLEITS